MQIENNKKWKKIVLVVLAGLFSVAIALGIGFLVHSRIYSANISIMVAPSTAKVKIGDMEFSASGETKIMPGEYTVEISADGFNTKTLTITAKADETTKINLFLDPANDVTGDWYTDHPEDALIVGEIENQEMIEKSDEIVKKESVLKDLPLTVEYYSDDHGKYVKYTLSYEVNDSERGFSVIMKDYTGEGVEAGFSKLREMGMDLTGLQMGYEDLTESGLNGRAE